jgi:hypothetical protein
MKKFIVIALMALVIGTSLFATRIGVTYQGIDYVLNTSTSVTQDDTAYFYGMYDALAAVKEGRQMYEIYQIIEQKTFLNASNQADSEQKNRYISAFKDFMSNYSEGSIGAFSDIYPIYDTLMNGDVSYANARLIVEFGGARFYPRNL